jgi:hypothetical protein
LLLAFGNHMQTTRLITTSAVVALSLAFAGCLGADGEGDGDGGVDTEESVDVKADIVRPLGTFTVANFQTGLGQLSLRSDNSYKMITNVVCIVASCNRPERTGSYKYSSFGSHRYIRFFDNQNKLVDRYEYTLRSKTLTLRLVNTNSKIVMQRFSGQIQSEANFTDSSDHKQCSLPAPHCITNNSAACPQVDAPDPSSCVGGRFVTGAMEFVASADGFECTLPTFHCVTDDRSSCPQISPLPPGFCSDGTVVRGEPRFIGSGDGKECQMPSVHCVTKKPNACPLVAPVSPDFCPM